MKKYTLFTVLFILVIFSSCFKGEQVDIVIYNAVIHSMNNESTIYEAMAIHDGKIVAIGPEREILNRFRGKTEVNAKKKDIIPGLHDAHAHLLGLAFKKTEVDLTGCKSYYDMLLRLEKFAEKHPDVGAISGWGWDQSLWGDTLLPDNQLLNEQFPAIPVVLSRVDAHTVLANDAALQLANISAETKIDGGIIGISEGKLTGILVDKAMDLVKALIPPPSKELLIAKINEIQHELFSLGVTHVHEAGLYNADFRFLDELASNGTLKINTYGMLFPDNQNIAFAKENGIYENGPLTIRSFKLMLDGALGSEGACLLMPYANSKNHYGMMLQSIDFVNDLAQLSLQLGYQLNTHCIGDSANRTMLNVILANTKTTQDHRWRIEHAQVMHPDDFELFAQSGALPSVQPTHAVSDYRWAVNKLGRERMKTAYAYQQLLAARQMMLFGTDFPVEDINPFATIFAAVKRKNIHNEPADGFQLENALTLEQSLKAMTIWAAYGAFDENRTGSLEKGKDATLVILDQALTIQDSYQPNYAFQTYIKGNLVFSMD